MLVILGLLVGGVLSGKSLIRASELRSVTVDMQRYQAALHSFRERYFSLPGDMPNAVKFWGAQAGATTDGIDATCRALTTAATGSATCNGNGDGRIAATGLCHVDWHEGYRLWQHLQNAGLIEGKLRGAYMATSGLNFCLSSIPGNNVPASRINKAGFEIFYAANAFNASMNRLFFGTPFSDGDNYFALTAPILSGTEVWNIDAKLDDGKPFAGKIQTYIWNVGGNTCTPTTSTPTPLATMDYNFSPPGSIKSTCSFFYDLI